MWNEKQQCCCEIANQTCLDSCLLLVVWTGNNFIETVLLYSYPRFLDGQQVKVTSHFHVADKKIGITGYVCTPVLFISQMCTSTNLEMALSHPLSPTD